MKFGKVFYSNYFKAKCVVVHYISDDNWYFVTEKSPIVRKAQSKFSVAVTPYVADND